MATGVAIDALTEDDIPGAFLESCLRGTIVLWLNCVGGFFVGVKVATWVFIVFAACARICLLAILLQLLQYIRLSWHTESIILPKRVAGAQ